MPNEPTWLACEQTAALVRLVPSACRALAASGGLAPDDPLLEVAATGGKALRPTLLLLSAALCGADPAPLLRPAAAVELLHVATLYHDDIIDRAPTRRGVVAAPAAHGDGLAALGGSYLLGVAVGALIEMGGSAHRLALSALSRACAGELHEVENVFDCDVDLATYVKVVEMKTSSLLILPCLLGADAADAPEPLQNSLEAYAFHLGLAFQFIDDLLDLVGDPAHTGKATGTDIAAGIYSLPVLLCLRDPVSGPRLKSLLQAAASGDTTGLGQAREIVRTSRATDATRRMVELHTRHALQATDGLPEGSARTSLRQLASWGATRGH